MTKKRKQSDVEEQRQSRKEVLRARKQDRQNRQIRLAVIGVIALLAVVFSIGFVNELLIEPTLPVAIVNGTEITLDEWQDRVRFQRAQLVIGIEDLEETVGGDIGLVQQFAGQQINLLLQPDVLGQLVLEDMIDSEIIRQGAEIRGITVSEEEVDARIEENFNYHGGESPTPFPTATETVMPTPSLTPIPTAVITEALPTNTPLPSPTAGPTASPQPTATAVSLEAFQEEVGSTLERFRAYGVEEETYRNFIREQLYREKLTEALAEEEGFLTEDEHASFFIMSFDTESEAEEALAVLEDDDFLTVWNTIRSRPRDPESEDTATAQEALWRRMDAIEGLYGEAVAAAAFSLDVGESSEILVEEAATEEETDKYYIIQVSGREVRPLSENTIQQEKDQVQANWLENQTRTGVETFERWQQSVPRQPILDTRFLVQPTAAPPQPTIPLPEIPEVPEVEEGEEEQ
jgi:hypothetical protein